MYKRALESLSAALRLDALIGLKAVAQCVSITAEHKRVDDCFDCGSFDRAWGGVMGCPIG